MALQGAWSFNENSGTTAADSTGNNFTANDVPGWSASGHTGAALANDGSATGASVDLGTGYDFTAPNNVNEENVTRSTFMCWFRLNSLKADQQIMRGPRMGGSYQWTVAVTAAGVLYTTGEGTVTTSATLTTGTWYHVALAVDWGYGSGGVENNVQVYLNSALVGFGTGFPLHNGSLLYWGGYDVALDGRVDDARWDSVQLSQSEIQTFMNTPVSAEAGPTATRWWKSDDGTWLPMNTVLNVGTSQAGSLKGWELTSANTGIAKHGLVGTNLAVYAGLEKPLSGTRITEKWIQTGLDISNGNIIIERCYVAPTNGSGSLLMGFDNNTVTAGKGPVTVTDCTITGVNLSQQDAAFSLGIQAYGTFTGNYITNVGSGIGFLGSGDYSDSLVEGNYVTNLVAWGDPDTTGNHSDAFTIRDYSNAVESARKIEVLNNRFNCESGNDTGACFIQTYSGDIDNTIIQGNYLEGGGYVFGLNTMNGNTVSNLQMVDNRFRSTGYGNASADGITPIAAWVDNYVYSAGQVDARGAVVPMPDTP